MTQINIGSFVNPSGGLRGWKLLSLSWSNSKPPCGEGLWETEMHDDMRETEIHYAYGKRNGEDIS